MKITNEVLHTEIQHLHEKIDGINAWLKEINGSTKSNTAFMNRQAVINKIFMAGGSLIIATLVGTLIKTLIGG